MKPVEKFTILEALNFFLTNRLPRRLVTRFFGKISHFQNRLFVKLSLYLWQVFSSGLDLSEAKEKNFKSIHQCFIRELKPGLRKIDLNPEYLTSPCDAIVGAHGRLDGIKALQIKGAPYSLAALLNDEILASRYQNGLFITLRLRSTMYHRFHAPAEGSIANLTYQSGDAWNVNAPALKRVPELFCKNERLIIPFELAASHETVLIVPVAAVLVASIQIHGLDKALDLEYGGPTSITLNRSYKKGNEMGYFQHGSTILMFTPDTFCFDSMLKQGASIKYGQPLIRTI